MRIDLSRSAVKTLHDDVERVPCATIALAMQVGFAYDADISTWTVLYTLVSKNAPLVAILFADLENFSALMSRDEVETIAFVERCLSRARRATLRFGGVFLKTTGDGWISLFPSASGAVECARLFLRLTSHRETAPPSQFRVAVHLGEVHIGGGDAYGHAINVAARMEAFARPGAIVVSQPVMQQISSATDYHLEALGHPNLKNIGDDLLLYRVVEGPAASDRVSHIRLSVIGGLRTYGDGGAHIALGSAYAAAFLGFLAVQGEEPSVPDRIAVMLWPSKTPRDARASLWRLRRHINERLTGAAGPAVLLEAGLLSLNRRTVDVDLHALCHAVEAADIDPALRLGNDVVDTILLGMDAVSHIFAAWLTVRRTMWRERLVGALELCLERVDAANAVTKLAAEALLRFEPGHEPASLALMRHLAARGWTGAALREHERLVAHLRNSHGAEPGENVAALAATLRRGETGNLVAAKRSPVPRLPQIAVGSITGAEGERASIAEVFRGDLLANLSRFRVWAVLDVPDDRFGAVDYALLGRMSPESEGIQIGFRLIEPESRRVAWVETVSVSATEWRTSQSGIVGRIAAALELYISGDRRARAISAPPEGQEEYDMWVAGEALLLRWTPEAEDEAQQLFKDLIGRAPAFAPAYASLASIYNVHHILHPGAPRKAAAGAAALACAARAVELDPMDARNHLALAWTGAMTGRFDMAAVHLDLAMSLNPYSPQTTISAAMGYSFLGDQQRALAHLDAAISRTPMLRPHQWCYAAAVRFLAGDDAGAVAAARASGDQIADNQGWLAAAVAGQGRTAEAQAAFSLLMETLAPLWDSEVPIDRESVHRWFVGAYPIREQRDRDALSEALRQAMPSPVLRAIAEPGKP